MRIRFQLLLIVLLSLVVFYPTLFAEFCRVDDLQMVESLKNTKQISLKDLFIPGSGSGLYYRPFIIISFLMDRFIFGLDSFTMHLHNIVLHTFNALLLFRIAKKLLRVQSLDYPYVPLIASLLFVIHPITTESVNWISGRTDILAATFLLGCTAMLLAYIEQNRRIHLYYAFVLFICAVLTKEFSLAFFPAFIFLASYRHTFSFSLKSWVMFLLLGISAIGIFFLLRSMAFTSNATPIRITLMMVFNTPERTLQLVLTAIGFYMKKLFIPYPLNFAIYEVNALYEFVAWPILALLSYIAWKRTLLSILFLSGIVLITPALVIVLNQIAWTPYAERYLYLPAAFVTLSTTCYLRKHLQFSSETIRVITIALVLAVCAGVTFQRNLVWQTAYGIVNDTVQKSPESTDMKFVYSSILIDRGEYAKARTILATVKSSPGFFYDERGDLVEVNILEREGKQDAAIQQLELVVKNSNNKSKKALHALVDFYSKEISKGGANALQYRQKLYDTRKKLYRVTYDNSLLYELGNDAYQLGNFEKARVYFELATHNIPLKDPKNKQAQARLLQFKNDHQTH